MIRILLFTTSLFFLGFGVAQENSEITKAADVLAVFEYPQDSIDGWKKGGDLSINFSQVALNNWAGGGQNSISVTGFLNLFANLRKGKYRWDNALTLSYGLMQQGETPLYKTDDKIDFSSKYGRKAFGNWYYSGLINFRTQFDNGYKSASDLTLISRFMAPAYAIAAVGMDYKPTTFFTLFISPLTSKTTFVLDDSLSADGAYGVEMNKNVRYELGGYLKVGFKKEIMSNVNLSTTVDFFSNYLNNPQNIDVNWQLLLAMKVNKYLTTSIATNLLYDDDVHLTIDEFTNGPRVQFKEVLSVGLTLKF